MKRFWYVAICAMLAGILATSTGCIDINTTLGLGVTTTPELIIEVRDRAAGDAARENVEVTVLSTGSHGRTGTDGKTTTLLVPSTGGSADYHLFYYVWNNGERIEQVRTGTARLERGKIVTHVHIIDSRDIR